MPAAAAARRADRPRRGTYRALVRGAIEMPPKIGVHPRADAFLHAMPAYLRETDAVTLKWVSGFPDNPARGLPFISGVIVVNDADTGLPVAILDAAEITAARTAAASGVCIRAWAPEAGVARRSWAAASRAAITPGCFATFAPTRSSSPSTRCRSGCSNSRAACWPRTRRGRRSTAPRSSSPRARSSRPPSRRSPDWLGSGHRLLLPIDFDFYVSAASVDSADLFVSDDVPQFEAYRDHGHFRGWKAPACSVGAALERGLTGGCRRLQPRHRRTRRGVRPRRARAAAQQRGKELNRENRPVRVRRERQAAASRWTAPSSRPDTRRLSR